MKTLRILIFFFLSLLTTAPALADDDSASNPVVILHTSKGAITLELFPDRSPIAVANFLEYAKSGFYEGTIFHRVKKRFVIQAGGYTADLQKKATRDPIINESANRLNNDRYTVAMARQGDPDSATSQFFINMRINASLDGNRRKPGYTVFGKVIDGHHVVQTIAQVKTRRFDIFPYLPVEPIVIETVEIQ